MPITNFMYWLDKGLDVAKVIAGNTPIGAVITIVDAVVDESNKEQGVSDSDVKNIVSRLAKSKWNSLNTDKLDRINAILDGK